MSSPVRRELEEYVAGRVTPERAVIAATVAYYRDAGSGMRDALQPLIEVIDRASPGIVELQSVSGASGFEVRLAERAFPSQYEPELRQAAQAALAGLAAPAASAASLGFLDRIAGALRRLFSASA